MPAGSTRCRTIHFRLPVHLAQGPIRGPRCSVAAGELVRLPRRRRTSRPADTRPPLLPGAARPRRSRIRRNSTPGEVRSRVPRRTASPSSSAGRTWRGRDEVRVPGPALLQISSNARAVPAWCAPTPRRSRENSQVSQLWSEIATRRFSTRPEARAAAPRRGGSRPPASQSPSPSWQTPAGPRSDRRRRGGRRDRSGHNARGLRGATAQLARREPHTGFTCPRAPPGGRRPRRKRSCPMQCEDASLESQRRRSPRSSTSATRPVGKRWDQGRADCAAAIPRHSGCAPSPARPGSPLPGDPAPPRMDIIIDCTAPLEAA